MKDEGKIPVITRLLEQIGDHEIVGGYYASIDPASDTPDVTIMKVHAGGVVETIHNKDNLIYNFNFNDHKILEMLQKKDKDATGNQDSL